ncbi:2-dehydro-3-deoxy-6-phosphogalactonate aldolase [Sphingomonas sp. Leaf407]|uniref:2-dehydro-3-deoxy-6-phosphogalactonate aldolase n=1 Tax=unclassified Sphingomonas TaxID=196159 RepID=UPI0007006853|nr:MULTISPECIES: 2-dehydro-3-deoxy-6-phosphogalactonate aldolase [unclassified Sphingomonas]KQN36490.1 2-dehydro-3-deoxy-6-phosphogalactonate aldolase [Sphingomonas sp. Leaf42]KQT27111.1 2-dehydro-3-deoxy-6-phosphogalactonate aldolase [Sphingomonas sp. Leaf407]
MSHLATFDAAFTRCPLVAILRGVQPHEVDAIGDALLDAGFTIVEVPLNSPEPYESITRLSQRLAGYAVVGAGTVLTLDQVAQVEAAGGTLIISPNANPAVITAAADRGLVAMPGIATPTEAFAALEAGAAALKLFPAEAASPAVMKAMRAVLPRDVRMLPVGGIVPSVLADWHKAGAAGYGLGSALYVPGMDAATVGERARAFVAAWKALEQ